MDLYIGVLKVSIFFKTELIFEKRAIINRLRKFANERFNTSFVDLESYNDFTNIDLAFINASANKELILSVFNNIITYIKQIDDILLIKEQVKLDKHN